MTFFPTFFLFGLSCTSNILSFVIAGSLVYMAVRKVNTFLCLLNIFLHNDDLYCMMHPIYATALQLNHEIKLALSDCALLLYKGFVF